MPRRDDFAHPPEFKGRCKETKDFLRDASILVIFCLGLGIFLWRIGFNFHQILSISLPWGMLEKEERYYMSFRRWIGIGITTSIVSAGIAYLILLTRYNHMP